jgi:hypothetical protein
MVVPLISSLTLQFVHSFQMHSHKQQNLPYLEIFFFLHIFFKQTSTMWKQYRVSGHVRSRRDWSMRSSQCMSLSSFTHVCSYNSLSVRVRFSIIGDLLNWYNGSYISCFELMVIDLLMIWHLLLKQEPFTLPWFTHVLTGFSLLNIYFSM